MGMTFIYRITHASKSKTVTIVYIVYIDHVQMKCLTILKKTAAKTKRKQNIVYF